LARRDLQGLERVRIVVLAAQPMRGSSVVQVERTFERRKWSRIAFWQDALEEQRQLRGRAIGYFSASRSIASWTMSRRTALRAPRRPPA
jgi:hypothetical protein